jgi:hypothetical protein
MREKLIKPEDYQWSQYVPIAGLSTTLLGGDSDDELNTSAGASPTITTLRPPTLREGLKEGTSEAPVPKEEVPPPGTPYQTLADKRAATETDFAKYEPTAPSAEVTAGETFVTPESTVSGQLEAIMSKQGPLQKLAASRAKEQAAALGMESSSAAIGASYKAQLDAALPIAQQDAKTMAEFKAVEQQAVNERRRVNQEAQVSGDLTLQKANLQEQQKKIDDSFALSMKGLDANTEKFMMDTRAEWDKSIATHTAALEQSLKDSEVSAQTEMLLMNQAQESMTQVQISMQNLLGNNEFLDNMARADKASGQRAGTSLKNYMNRLLGTSTNTIRFNAQAAGLYTPEFRNQLNVMIANTKW